MEMSRQEAELGQTHGGERQMRFDSDVRRTIAAPLAQAVSEPETPADFTLHGRSGRCGRSTAHLVGSVDCNTVAVEKGARHWVSNALRWPRPRESRLNALRACPIEHWQ